jgi:hypothetical protein
MTLSPPMSVPPHDVFEVYGLADTYAPPFSQATYAVAARLALVSPDPTVTAPDDLPNLMSVVGPLSGNVTAADGKTTLTAAVRQYQSDGTYDPHLVAFKSTAARTDIARFFAQLAAHQVPQVGP